MEEKDTFLAIIADKIQEVQPAPIHPSEWKNIQVRLEPQRKRPIFTWWRLSFALFLLAGTTLWWGQYQQGSDTAIEAGTLQTQNGGEKNSTAKQIDNEQALSIYQDKNTVATQQTTLLNTTKQLTTDIQTTAPEHNHVPAVQSAAKPSLSAPEQKTLLQKGFKNLQETNEPIPALQAPRATILPSESQNPLEHSPVEGASDVVVLNSGVLPATSDAVTLSLDNVPLTSEAAAIPAPFSPLDVVETSALASLPERSVSLIYKTRRPSVPQLDVPSVIKRQTHNSGYARIILDLPLVSRANFVYKPRSEYSSFSSDSTSSKQRWTGSQWDLRVGSRLYKGLGVALGLGTQRWNFQVPVFFPQTVQGSTLDLSALSDLTGEVMLDQQSQGPPCPECVLNSIDIARRTYTTTVELTYLRPLRQTWELESSIGWTRMLDYTQQVEYGILDRAASNTPSATRYSKSTVQLSGKNLVTAQVRLSYPLLRSMRMFVSNRYYLPVDYASYKQRWWTIGVGLQWRLI